MDYRATEARRILENSGMHIGKIEEVKAALIASGMSIENAEKALPVIACLHKINNQGPNRETFEILAGIKKHLKKSKKLAKEILFLREKMLDMKPTAGPDTKQWRAFDEANLALERISDNVPDFKDVENRINQIERKLRYGSEDVEKGFFASEINKPSKIEKKPSVKTKYEKGTGY